MEEDIYKQFTGRLCLNAPQLQAKEDMKNQILNSIEDRSKGKMRLIFSLRRLAGILMLISIGSYAWFEATTQQSRRLMQGNANEVYSTVNADWPCRQTLNILMSALQKTDVILFNDDKMLLRRDRVLRLKEVNRPLYRQLIVLLKGVGQSHPQIYQAFLSGEEIRLSAWQLRKEYRVCEWLTN